MVVQHSSLHAKECIVCQLKAVSFLGYTQAEQRHILGQEFMAGVGEASLSQGQREHPLLEKN